MGIKSAHADESLETVSVNTKVLTEKREDDTILRSNMFSLQLCYAAITAFHCGAKQTLAGIVR